MESTLEQKKIKFDKTIAFINDIDTVFFLAILIGGILIVASPFVFIWGTFVVSIKIFFTGLVAILISLFFREVCKGMIKKIKLDFETKQ